MVYMHLSNDISLLATGNCLFLVTFWSIWINNGNKRWNLSNFKLIQNSASSKLQHQILAKFWFIKINNSYTKHPMTNSIAYYHQCNQNFLPWKFQVYSLNPCWVIVTQSLNSRVLRKMGLKWKKTINQHYNANYVSSEYKTVHVLII